MKDISVILLFVISITLVICLPQINISNYPKPTITSKFLFFIYTCLILSQVIILYVSKIKQKDFLISKIDISLALLFLWIFFNRYCFQIDYSFSIRYMELLGLGFIYLILRNLKTKMFYGLFLAIILSGIMQAIYGNLQILGYYQSNHSGFKITGSFFNPGPYAGFLISVFPIALGIYIFKEKVIDKVIFNNITKSYLRLNTFIKYTIEYISLIGIISIILVIPATQSRASWLAILISSILLIEFRYRILKKVVNHLTKLKKVILITFSLLIIGISLFGFYHFKQGSSDGRLFIWKVSKEIIKDNPIFGVGFDRFKAHYMNYQADYFLKHGETAESLVADNTNYAFNTFIQFVVENGIVGFILLISVLYLIIKASIIKENNYLGIIIKTSLLSISIFAFFSYPMEILPIKLVIVFLLALLTRLDQNKLQLLQNFNLNSSVKSVLKTVAITGILVITLFSVRYLNNLDISLKNWKLALNSYQYGDYESAIQEYEVAYPYLKNNGDFLMNYGKALSIYKEDKKAIKILEQAKTHLNNTIIETASGDVYKNIKQYKEAETYYKQATNMIPSRFYPLYLLAKLYDESGQKEKALAMAKNILEKEIKVPSTAIKEIQQEMNDLTTKLNTK